jgi:hypothetical protein
VQANAHALVTERNVSKAGGLLHSLVPRAQLFCYYNSKHDCIWNSDGAEDYEIDNFVAELPREVVDRLVGNDESLRRTLSSGRTVLALPVLDESEKAAGLLVAMFSKNDGKSSSFNPSLIKKILEIRDLESSVEEIEKELEFVYAVDEIIYGASKRHSNLAQLVGRSGRYLGINYSVLLIPSKRIRISATHSNWKNVNRKVLDRYLVEQLMPKLDGQRKPAIFEIPADDTPESAKTGYQTLLCPLLDKQGNVEGILAQLGKVNHK